MNLTALIALFIAWPIIELALLVEVHRALGFAATLAIVVVTGVLGASLARFQGLLTLHSIHRDLEEGRMPAPRVMDGVMILVAGILLITPGLISDGIGFLLLMPAVRARIRTWLRCRFERSFSTGIVDVDEW